MPENNWLRVAVAPADVDLEVGVTDSHAVVTLVFPVRKKDVQWVNAKTKKPVDINPTHWRPWQVEH